MSADWTSQATPELSRPFRVALLAEAPVQAVEITATAAERAALAARFGLVRLDALTARLTVRGSTIGELLVEGQLQADVVQECVVTLEPVSDSIDTTFDQRFSTAPTSAPADLVIGPDDDEPPEPITGDSIDLGELVAQFLSLAINPYPRAPGADAEAARYEPDPAGDGPFAALARLRERSGE